jgi:predicted dehydrogenase
MAPPANLDYEMWTGPAPMRPYNRMVHPRGWRNFMEYGNGIMGDMGVHMLDMARWMLGLGWPISISSSGGISFSRTARPIFPTRRRRCLIMESASGLAASHLGDPPDPKYYWGATFTGTKEP